MGSPPKRLDDITCVWDRTVASQAARAREAESAVGRGGRKDRKLAPFGICKQIEVISSGGPATAAGYLTSHFILDFDRIVSDDTDVPVKLDKGALDQSYRPQRGTTVVLTNFLPKRVPDGPTFMRQLERRFALAAEDFEVLVRDTRVATAAPLKMTKFAIPIVDETRIPLEQRPCRWRTALSYLSRAGWLWP
ncbi:hypothetical protein HR12_47340, partial [Microbacterium sp. SUBG005]